MAIDLNADIGEGFGVYRMGDDESLMPWITSVNIACGFHAGDPTTMRRAVEQAVRHGRAIGAHPGLPDRLGFGRRAMRVTPAEARDLILYQVGALEAFVRAAGSRVAHVKPHGALYHMAEGDSALARAIAESVGSLGDDRILIGLAGGALVDAGRRAGVPTAAEAFADRAYLADGTLVPRDREGSVLETEAAVVAQCLTLARSGTVATRDGTTISVRADTICFHGDTPSAARMARAARGRLEGESIAVRPPCAADLRTLGSAQGESP
ncbi:MAG: LamB/YcsF family protein [Planctomycetes bacterium]|nr:LamB/YcsF family protein [Planctomycetota bacterium]